MDSDRHLHHHQQQQPMSSGLMRYRSAPSSYFESLINSSGVGGGENCDEFLNPRHSSPETERFFSKFMSGVGTEDLSSHSLSGVRQNSSVNEALQPQFAESKKHTTDIYQRHEQQQNSNYSSSSQTIYQNQTQSCLPNHNSPASNSDMDKPYSMVSSTPMDSLNQMKMGSGGGNSNLIRQSSSPAGFFSHINMDNGTPFFLSLVKFIFSHFHKLQVILNDCKHTYMYCKLVFKKGYPNLDQSYT